MKKLLFAALAVVCAVALTGCKKEENEAMDGAYEQADSPVITEDIKKLVETATKDEEDTYTPVAYVASQVVAGTNHLILCSITNDKSATYALITIYEDLDGNAELSAIQKCNGDDYTEGSAGAGGLMGGWNMPETVELDDDAKETFSKIKDNAYTPLALIGQQVVAGMNYCYLCKEDDETYKLVYIYQDLSGNVEITDDVGFGEEEIL